MLNSSVRGRHVGYAGAALLALVFPVLAGNNQYYLSVAINVALFAVPALAAWVLLAGGLWSFGQGAFASLGAYTSALLMMHEGWSFWITAPLGGVFAAVIAAIVAYPFLRATGVAFSILTLVSLLALDEVILIWGSLTGGGGGLIGVPALPQKIGVAGTYVSLVSLTGQYYVLIAAFLVALLLVLRLEGGGYIRTLRAIAQQEGLAESVGIHTKRYRAMAFVFASFFTGITGAYSASYLQVAHPQVWGLFPSIFIVAYAIVGGTTIAVGPVVGTIVVIGGTAALSSIGAISTDNLQPIVVGAGLMLVVLVLPHGLAGLPADVIRLLRHSGHLIRRGRDTYQGDDVVLATSDRQRH